MQKKRLEARFEGRVQGVGFRWTTVSVASGYDVSGFVRNESDGSVTVVAEGSEEALKAFLSALRRSRMGRYIDQEDMAWTQARDAFDAFGIRYS